ncbi:hypothetical protein ACVMAJ_001571 [Bradyrhizobium sp. USDA 4448]
MSGFAPLLECEQTSPSRAPFMSRRPRSGQKRTFVTERKIRAERIGGFCRGRAQPNLCWIHASEELAFSHLRGKSQWTKTSSRNALKTFASLRRRRTRSPESACSILPTLTSAGFARRRMPRQDLQLGIRRRRSSTRHARGEGARERQRKLVRYSWKMPIYTCFARRNKRNSQNPHSGRTRPTSHWFCLHRLLCMGLFSRLGKAAQSNGR